MNTSSMTFIPAITGSQVSLPAGIEQMDREVNLLVDTEAGSFDQLIQQFIANGEGQSLSEEQLDALRSTLEEVDDSEVLGFLAMMQAQSAWTPDSQSTQSPLAGLMPVVNNDTAKQAELYRTDLGTAINEALGKAMDELVPTAAPVRKAPEMTSNVVAFPTQRMESNNLLERESGFSRLLLDQQSLNSDSVSLRTKSNELNQQLTSMQSNLLQTAEADAVQSTVSRVTVAVSRADMATDVRAQMAQQPAVQTNITMDKPVWADAMGQRLMAMVSEGRNETHIRLDPPELGALAVRITAQEAGISVQFNSDQAQVRELLQTEASRLRIALEEHGMNLLDVNVGSEGRQEHSEGSEGAGHSRYLASEEDMEVLELPVPDQALPLSNTLINTFA